MSDFRLKVFQSVARNLSFTKASNELYITQPAVTKHIKELESEYEVKLFNRSGNRITLTPAGIILLSHADHMMALHNEIKFDLSQLKGNHQGNMRLGASTTIAQYVIPADLAKFHEKFPDIQLSLISGNTEYIEKLLLKGEIDIGIVEGKPSHADIKYTPFLNDELLIFTSSRNIEYKTSVNIEELVHLPLVLRERGSGTLEIIEKKLQQLKIIPRQLNILMYLGSTEAIKSFIKTGNGVGIVSRFAITQELENNTFKLITAPDLRFLRLFYFISAEGPEPTGITKLFINFLQNHYNF
jgi:LysR family transcriptional regulator, transcriptional activator of the cysJI operon